MVAQMPWFIAHAILSLEHLEEPRDHCLVWENLLLVEAPDAQVAWALAEARAIEDATPEDMLFLPDGRPCNRLGGRPAKWRYAGVRKVVQVSHETEQGLLRSGDEVSYNEFEVSSPAEADSLARGEAVLLRRTAVRYPSDD